MIGRRPASIWKVWSLKRRPVSAGLVPLVQQFPQFWIWPLSRNVRRQPA